MKKQRTKKKNPTGFRETDEITKLLDIAERLTGKTRTDIIREAVMTEVPKIVKREAPNVLHREQAEAQEKRKMWEDFDVFLSEISKPEGRS